VGPALALDALVALERDMRACDALAVAARATGCHLEDRLEWWWHDRVVYRSSPLPAQVRIRGLRGPDGRRADAVDSCELLLEFRTRVRCHAAPQQPASREEEK
jgi:hypothetical protein